MPEPEPMSVGSPREAAASTASRVGLDAWREAISSAFVPLVASPESLVGGAPANHRSDHRCHHGAISASVSTQRTMVAVDLRSFDWRLETP